MNSKECINVDSEVDTELCITITGHRFWRDEKAEKRKLFSSLEILMESLSVPVTFIHGCAYGVDIWFGEFARINNIDFRMYFPFTRIIQIVRSKYDVDFFKELNLQYGIAKKVVYVSETFFTYGYQKRNKVLVDDSNLLCTYFTRKRSGSGNCYKYALKKEIPTVDLYDEDNLEKRLFSTRFWGGKVII